VAHSLAEDICRQLSTTTANASANETVKAYAINSEDETNTPSDNTTSTAFDIAAEKYLMTKLMSADCLSERNRVLRSRYLAASQEEVLQERDRGLRACNDNYLTASRELHTCVYNTSFVAEDILLPSELLTQIPGVYPLDPPPHDDALPLPSPPLPSLPDTFTFPLLTETCCATLYAELIHYESTARDNPELQLPLHIRHDGNLGNLESCGFAAVLKAIENIWQPLLARFMPEKGNCEVYHAFLTQNWVAWDAIKTHCDKSNGSVI